LRVVYAPSFLFQGDQRAFENLCILRDRYGVGMEDELFERDMKELRSVLKCRDAGAEGGDEGQLSEHGV
jgi:hypothetical protein